MSNQPGASLFGQALAQRRTRPSLRKFVEEEEEGEDGAESSSSSDSSSEERARQQRATPAYEDSSDDESDDGTIYSTKESARRTPAQIQKERAIQKQSLLNELIQMKRDGYKLSRDYSADDPIELMSMEIENQKNSENENTMVGIYKVVINMGCHGLQMLNTVKGPWLPMEGWAEAVTADMNVYDRPLRRIHRQYFSRGPAGNPWVELGFALIGSLVFHIMVAKMMGTKNGAAMFAKMFNSGGITGALAGMAGMGNGAPQVGPGQMPQSTPNPSNPYKNHNVPPVPPQPRAPPRPPPQPPRHQPPPSYPVDRAPPTVNRAPVTSARPPVHPQQAGIRPESYHPPSRPTPKTERQKKRKPMRRPGMVMQSPRPYVPPSPSKDDMGSESTMNLDTSE